MSVAKCGPVRNTIAEQVEMGVAVSAAALDLLVLCVPNAVAGDAA